MSGLQGLRGWKVRSFLGLSMALVVTMFMFRVETVLPGAPDVCEEPCEDEAVLPRDSTPVPAPEPFEAAPIDLGIAPDGSPTDPVETQVTEPSAVTAVTIETPSPVEVSLPAPGKESAAARREEAAKREKSAAAGPLVPVEAVLDELSRPSTALPPEPRLLPFRLIVPTPRSSTPVVRGAMGYRAPLVVKQEVPDQIQGGVYIPAHEAYVVLRPGYWDLEGANEGLTETEHEASATKGSGDVVKPEPKRSNWLRRLFRRKGKGADSSS